MSYHYHKAVSIRAYLERPWDLVTINNWEYNRTYNWGNPYKPILGDYKEGYKPSYMCLLSPMGLQVEGIFPLYKLLGLPVLGLNFKFTILGKPSHSIYIYIYIHYGK